MRPALLVLLLPLAACAEQAPPPAAPPAAPPPAAPAPAAPPAAAPAAPVALKLAVTPIALPGATGAVSLDYLVADRAAGEVWVPAGDTGSADVIDASGKLVRIEGFPTVERESHGAKRRVGPSSATVGGGFAYVGNRANSEVCAIASGAHTRAGCLALPFAPDGLQYIAATKEVWATTPKDKSIHIIDASAPAKLSLKGRVAVEGSPEGYAIDEGRGLFYTNLEDKDKTLTIDVRTRKVTATWDTRCGGDGPRGLALDTAKDFLVVACTDRALVLDAAHGGAQLSQLQTGEGVDNIDYLQDKGQLYVAAGKAGKLTVAHMDDKGALTSFGEVATAPGTRVVVAGADGTAYVADGKQARVLVVKPAP